MSNYSIDFINQAKELFLQGFSFRKIAQQLGVKQYATVFHWSKKYSWKKDSPKYPLNSLKDQLDQCTDLVNKLRPEIDKADILRPSKEDRELLLNYNRFSNLQLKLMRQITGLKVSSGKSSKKSIFD
jgi:uncharacterized protein YjcR